MYFRLVQALKESPTRGGQLYQGTSKITMAHDAIQAIKQLRRDVVEAMRSLMKLAKEKQTSGMLPICEDMISKTRILLSLWDPGLVEEALTFLEEHKVAKMPEEINNDENMTLDFKANRSLSPFKRITQQFNFDLKSPDFDDFVTPDTPECVQDIWAKESAKSKYSTLVATTKSSNETAAANDNFVIFPDVEEDKRDNERSNGNCDENSNEDEDKEKGELDQQSKRFLDMQKMCNSPSANYYKPTDEPEPWDLTQLNIEASVMCLVSKVKFLCGRCSSPAVRLRNKNGIGKFPSIEGCPVKRRSNSTTVVTIQPTNGNNKGEENSKLLENSNGNTRKITSPGTDTTIPGFAKAKEGMI